jgi:hypothetical protein
MNPRAPRNLLVAAITWFMATALLLLYNVDRWPGVLLAAMLCDVAAVALVIVSILVRRRLKTH